MLGLKLGTQSHLKTKLAENQDGLIYNLMQNMNISFLAHNNEIIYRILNIFNQQKIISQKPQKINPPIRSISAKKAQPFLKQSLPQFIQFQSRIRSDIAIT